jgi:predicted nucleotidyltransferase
VYVDPVKYSENASYQEMVNIGRAVGRLNKVLPRRQFVLMGPGRWGSRGDIKLGVQVTYSDINNTAMLIEIARRKKDYLPELSFGTHFFQDLVEASIHYLPLYPDDSKIIFNEGYFNGGRNLLAELLPDMQGLSDIVRVIDVSSTSPGNILRVLLNADSDEAIGFISDPAVPVEFVESGVREFSPSIPDADSHWRWRLHAAENIAAHLDPSRFGVKAIYIIGSTKNATAGPQSDIDLMIHTRGTETQNKDLLTWLDGWSLSLAQINFQRTGLKSERLLDVHLITDDDIERGNSCAVKIGAVTDPARPLALGTALQKKN